MAVPSSKVHHKLLRATQVIIALVAEKESLLKESQWLKSELQALHQQLASHRSDKQPAAQRPLQNGAPLTSAPLTSAPPTIALSPHGSAQSNFLLQPGFSQPAAGAEVLIRAPPTIISAPPTTTSAPPIMTSAPPTTAPATPHFTEAPPLVVPPPHQQSVFILPSSLPPPTNHSSPIPPLLNESSDFEQQHSNLERLLCQLGHNESHASSCRSSPRHPPAPPLWEEERVSVAPSQGEEMGVQGVGVRPLPKHTTTTTKGPTKPQGRRQVHSKLVNIRNYNDRS